MPLPFPKTAHFKEKQELSHQIAVAYKDKASRNFNRYCARYIGREIYEDLTRKVLAGHSQEPVDLDLDVRRPDVLKAFAYLNAVEQLLDSAKNYDRFATSPFLYFTPESLLRRKLRELPPKRISVELPSHEKYEYDLV